MYKNEIKKYQIDISYIMSTFNKFNNIIDYVLYGEYLSLVEVYNLQIISTTVKIIVTTLKYSIHTYIKDVPTLNKLCRRYRLNKTLHIKCIDVNNTDLQTLYKLPIVSLHIINSHKFTGEGLINLPATVKKLQLTYCHTIKNIYDYIPEYNNINELHIAVCNHIDGPNLCKLRKLPNITRLHLKAQYNLSNKNLFRILRNKNIQFITLSFMHFYLYKKYKRVRMI